MDKILDLTHRLSFRQCLSVRGKITVKFGGQTKSATAGADGTWLVKLDALTASAEPRVLMIRGKNTVTVQSILQTKVHDTPLQKSS